VLQSNIPGFAATHAHKPSEISRITMKSDITEAGSASSILDQGQFDFYTVSEHGIEFKKGTPQGLWLKTVEQLTVMHESSGKLHFRAICILADALNFGEAEYGEEYAQAIDETRKWMQVSAKTIHNAMWVMSRVDATRRRELLTLSHHAEVASLDPKEQDELLALAEERNMTVAELHNEILERHPKTKRNQDRKAKAGSSKITITNATEAKAVATQLSNWLGENEDKATASSPLMDVIKHISQLYRRINDRGRKR
jgi:hypothetical protein